MRTLAEVETELSVKERRKTEPTHETNWREGVIQRMWPEGFAFIEQSDGSEEFCALKNDNRHFPHALWKVGQMVRFKAAPARKPGRGRARRAVEMEPLPVTEKERS